ncbi:MAG: ABC transporter substrate-binding protein, partial [Cyanobacteria bacterium J06643_5]
MKFLSFFFQVACIGLLIIACNNTSNRPTISSTPNQECVQNYNPNQDYFPDKATINYANGFTVEYKNNYKIVTVKNP